MTAIQQGCIDIWIDEIVPCLKDTKTSEIKETVVFKIESRNYLKKFQRANGWQKYIGVGGHLFAIAVDKSFKWGYEGAVHGFAANEELLKHYMNVFGAEYLGMLHQYQFFIDEEQAKRLLEVYHFEWNET